MRMALQRPGPGSESGRGGLKRGCEDEAPRSSGNFKGKSGRQCNICTVNLLVSSVFKLGLRVTFSDRMFFLSYEFLIVLFETIHKLGLRKNLRCRHGKTRNFPCSKYISRFKWAVENLSYFMSRFRGGVIAFNFSISKARWPCCEISCEIWCPRLTLPREYLFVQASAF